MRNVIYLPGSSYAPNSILKPRNATPSWLCAVGLVSFASTARLK